MTVPITDATTLAWLSSMESHTDLAVADTASSAAGAASIAGIPSHNGTIPMRVPANATIASTIKRAATTATGSHSDAGSELGETLRTGFSLMHGRSRQGWCPRSPVGRLRVSSWCHTAPARCTDIRP